MMWHDYHKRLRTLEPRWSFFQVLYSFGNCYSMWSRKLDVAIQNLVFNHVGLLCNLMWDLKKLFHLSSPSIAIVVFSIKNHIHNHNWHKKCCYNDLDLTVEYFANVHDLAKVYHALSLISSSERQPKDKMQSMDLGKTLRPKP